MFRFNNFGDYYETELIPFSTLGDNPSDFEILRYFTWTISLLPGYSGAVNIMIYDTHFHEPRFLWSEGFSTQHTYNGTYSDNLGNAAGLSPHWDYAFKIRFEAISKK